MYLIEGNELIHNYSWQILLGLLCLELIVAMATTIVGSWVILSLMVITLLTFVALQYRPFIPVVLLFFILTTLYTTYPDVGFYRYQFEGRNIYAMEVFIVLLFSFGLLGQLGGSKNQIISNLTMLDFLVVLWGSLIMFSVIRGFLLSHNSSVVAYESRFLLFILVYFLFSSSIDRRFGILPLLITLSAIGCFLFYVTIFNMISSEIIVRVGGQTRLLIGEHGFFFCMMSTMFLSFLIHERNKMIIYLVAFAICILMVIFSYQRTSYMQFAASSIIMGILAEKRQRKYFLWSSITIVAVAISLYVMFESSITAYVNALTERVSSIKVTTNDPSVLGRYIEYALSLVEIKNNPMIGTGMGTVIEYLAPSDNGPFPITRIVPHNEFIWMAFKNGIPSVLLFCLMVGYAVVKGRKVYISLTDPIQKAFVLGTITTVISIIVRSQFEDTLHKHRIGFMFWALLGIIAYYIRLHSSRGNQPSLQRT